MAAQAVASNVLQQFVDRAGTLYSLPAVAVEVLELTERANVDTRALRQCVERDPALTAKLLRVVNSSMFGLSREVSDLTQALALLGVKPLKLLVLGFSLPKELYHGVEAEALKHFWQFTLVKAVAARELSNAFWKGRGDEAFIAGLLQEIGILVLLRELGDAYTNFLACVQHQQQDLTELEAATLGFDHAILSARLLDHWNLPSVLVEAVAAPHDVDAICALPQESMELPATLHLASMIAAIVVRERSDLMPPMLEAAQRYRNLDVAQIDRVLDTLQEQVELMASLFAVSVDRQVSYRDIMARAHEQMSQAAMEALPQMIGRRPEGQAFQEQQALCSALDQYAQSFLDLSLAVSPAGATPAASPVESQRAAGPGAVVGRPTVERTSSERPASSDPGLRGRLLAGITRCRALKRELSLLLLEMDDFEHLLLMCGPDGVGRVVAAVRLAITSLADLPCESMVISDTCIAVILPDCDRRQAVQLARTLHDAVPAYLMERGELDFSISFSAGIASLAAPSPSSRPDELIDAADRCLFAARRSGGGTIKGIDVF